MKKLKLIKALSALFILILTSLSSEAQQVGSYAKEIMSGLSSKGLHPDKSYLTAGDRTYIVGTQDGNFPDIGSHVKGEMGGLWMQPIKLLDGFWLKLTDAAGTQTSLTRAKDFINYPYGNKFIYAPVLNGIEVERFQYCPQGKEGIVIQYTFHNTSAKLRYLNVDFIVKTDLSPVWFSKENNIIDAPDSLYWDDARQLFAASDSKNPWYTVWGSSLPVAAHTTQTKTPVETAGMGKAAATTHRLSLRPDETAVATFIISGSNKNIETARASYEEGLKNYDSLLNEKKKYYRSIINRSQVDISDKKLQQAYSWGKLNTEWLVCDLPGLGRFLGAGAVEYPWLFGCDNFYALQGVVASGDMELAKSTLRVIKSVSEKVNGNGRIIHEMSTNGYVGNKGNTQETAQFGVAVWKVFQWTGDEQFLKEMYPYIKKGLSWLLTEQDQNDNLFPEGYGIMEVKGLNAELIDVAVYTQQALEDASKMAALLQEPAVQKQYAQKAALLKNKINTMFWDNGAGSYCDFYGSREQAIQSAQGSIEQLHMETSSGEHIPNMLARQKFYADLIERFSRLPQGTKRGWLTNKNWVISTPVETGIAPHNQAIKLLDKVRGEDCGEYGPYLSAVDRQHMMTIATGVQAMAECTYGRTDNALWYINKIVQTFSRVLPGSISEMMPDYGCPVQAWTIYGLATPLVTKIFGINPNAHNKSIILTPNLPSSWDHMYISNLPINNNTISFGIKKTGKATVYNLTSATAGWTYTLKIKGQSGKRYVLNGKTITATSDAINLYGKENKVMVFN